MRAIITASTNPNAATLDQTQACTPPTTRSTFRELGVPPENPTGSAMSTRLSFGSRAGGSSDYQSGSQHGGMRHWSRGPFDTLDGLTDSLKLEIEAAQTSAVPDCTTVELHLSLRCLLPLHRPTIGPYAEGGHSDLPAAFKTSLTRDDGTLISDPFPKADVCSLINVADGRERQIVQRAASRGIIAALEGADGYRYSFNNAWTAKDEEGSRFSYICQDSMQNKDRHANGYTRTLKHLKGDGERGPRKPTYDCKGSISVKFSTTKQSVDVYYRHYAIHASVAERKPPLRPSPLLRASIDMGTPKESGGLAAALHSESLQTENAEQYASSALRMVDQSPYAESPLASRSEAANVARPLKRKREWIHPPAAHPPRDPDAPLSLMELLQESESANAPAAESAMPKMNRAAIPPPVHYELPSWQIPPPSLHRPGQGHASNYPPPYNPATRQVHSQPPPKTLSQSQNRQPSGSQPKAQGLFTTMKPVAKDWVVQTSYPAGKPGMPSYPRYNTFSQPSRAKASCTNCRCGKKKCDEQRPCGACVKSGRSDCIFEGAAEPQSSALWQQPPQNADSWGNLSRSSQQQQTPGWQNSHSSQNAVMFGVDTPGPSLAWPGS